MLPALFNKRWANPYHLKPLRYLLGNYVVQIFLSGYTTVMLIVLLEGWFRVKILRLCVNTFPSRFYRAVCKENLIMMKVLFSFEGTSASIFFGLLWWFAVNCLYYFDRTTEKCFTHRANIFCCADSGLDHTILCIYDSENLLCDVKLCFAWLEKILKCGFKG